MSFLSIKKTAIGIDIFDQAIEIVLLEKKGSKINLISKMRAVLIPGVIVQGKIVDKKILADTLNILFKKNKIKLSDHKQIVFGLPDSQSYVHTFSTKKIKKGDYDDIVFNELIKIVPIPVIDLTAGYTLVSDKKEEVNIISVGGDKNIVTDWQNFFLNFGIRKILIAPEKTTTEIGHIVLAKVGLSKTKSLKKTSKDIEIEYVEALGLAVSGLDKVNYKVPFFNDLLSDKEIEEKSGNTKVSVQESKKETDTSVFVENDEDQKLKKQKIILTIIAILGLIGISLAFWYQTEQTKKQQTFLTSKQTSFSVVQSFPLDIPIAIDATEKTIDRSFGRLVIDTFDAQAEEAEAVALSRIRAGQSLLNTETVWVEPIKIVNNTDKKNKKLTLSNYTISWLIYNKDEVNNLAVNKVSETLNMKDIKHAINNIERTTIKETENDKLLLMTVMVSVSLAENIQSDIMVQ